MADTQPAGPDEARRLLRIYSVLLTDDEILQVAAALRWDSGGLRPYDQANRTLEVLEKGTIEEIEELFRVVTGREL